MDTQKLRNIHQDILKFTDPAKIFSDSARILSRDTFTRSQFTVIGSPNQINSVGNYIPTFPTFPYISQAAVKIYNCIN